MESISFEFTSENVTDYGNTVYFFCNPRGFIKDMGIADEEALAADTRLGVLEDVLGMAKKLESEGMGDLGTQALIKYYKW